LLDAAIRAEPTDPRNRLLLIDYHLSRRDSKAALAAAQAADAAAPNSAEVLERLGRCQLASGNSQQAVGTFRRLAQLRPKAPEPYFMMSEAYLAINDAAAADTVLRQAVAAAPDNPAAHRELAFRLLRTKRNAEALSVARDLQQRLPKRVDGHVLESELHASLKDRAAAARALRAGLAVADDSSAAMRLYRLLVADKNVKEAEALATDWTKRHPDDVDFLRTLGDIQLQAHAYQAAERRYQEVLKLTPNDSKVLNNMAWLRHRLGQADALGYAERALALDAANPNVMDTLAQILMANQQVPRAVELAKRVMQAQDGNVALKLSAAGLLVKAGVEQPFVSAQLDSILRSDSQPFVAAEVKRLRAALKPA
jgi:putative PEP-CTERM system TPR-repeat lipoprotein